MNLFKYEPVPVVPETPAARRNRYRDKFWGAIFLAVVGVPLFLTWLIQYRNLQNELKQKVGEELYERMYPKSRLGKVVDKVTEAILPQR